MGLVAGNFRVCLLASFLFWVNFPPFLLVACSLDSDSHQTFEFLSSAVWIRVVAAQVRWHRGGGSLVEGRQERRYCEIVACEIGVGEIVG